MRLIIKKRQAKWRLSTHNSERAHKTWEFKLTNDT